MFSRVQMERMFLYCTTTHETSNPPRWFTKANRMTDFVGSLKFILFSDSIREHDMHQWEKIRWELGRLEC